MARTINNEFSVVAAYILVVGNYVSFCLFVAAFWYGQPEGNIIKFIYFPFLLMVHIVTMTRLEVSIMNGFDIFMSSDSWLKVSFWLLCWPCVFLQQIEKILWGYNIREKLFEKITHFANRWGVVYSIIKFMVLVLLIVLVSSYAESGFQITMAVISMIFLGFLTFYESEGVRSIYEMVAILFLILIMTAINLLLIPWAIIFDWSFSGTRSEGEWYCGLMV